MSSPGSSNGGYDLDNGVTDGELNALLVGRKYQLVYSTEKNSLFNGLPPRTKVVLEFFDAENMEYRIEFWENWMKNIKTKSSYELKRSNLTNQPALCFQYEAPKVKLFNFEFNVGAMKGQTNFILMTWFDGNIWVEEGWDGGERGKGDRFLNVYCVSS